MSKFLVCKKTDPGCDYSIGCGMVYEWVDADSVYDATQKTIWPDPGYVDESDLEGEFALDEILIIPGHEVIAVDLDIEKQMIEAQRRREEMGEEEAAERAELARLKAKYE